MQENTLGFFLIPVREDWGLKLQDTTPNWQERFVICQVKQQI